MYPTVLVGVCALVRDEGRELPGVGNFYLSSGLSWSPGAYGGGDSPGCRATWLLGRAVATLPTQ